MTEDSIGSLLAYDNDMGIEQAVYYLSRALIEVERQYMSIEKLCLALYYLSTKLKYYTLSILVYVIYPMDIIKYMLMRSMLHGRIGKWMLTLSK